MKFIILVLMLSLSLFAFAKGTKDFSAFQKELQKHVEEVVKFNPEVYEQKNIYRAPTAVLPENEKIYNEDRRDKIKKSLSELPDW